jgi:hypothetical protein
MTQRLDRFGAAASSVCAVHCAMCAFLPAAFGALGLGALMGHEAEWAFTLVAVAFGSATLVFGWRRHRSKYVAGLLALGLTGLLAARGVEAQFGHHDEHGAESHAAALHWDANHHDDWPRDEREADESESPDHEAHTAGTHHDDSGHVMGASVGVLGGLLLFFGHLSNIRATRRCREEECA